MLLIELAKHFIRKGLLSGCCLISKKLVTLRLITRMSAIDLRYNYVIVGSEGYYLVGYRDIMGLDNVAYFTDFYSGFDTAVDRCLVRWNFSRKLNSIVSTPFSRYVFPRLYPHRFSDDKPLCYVFFGNRQYVYQTPYLDYLRHTQSDVRLVLYMQDLVERNAELCFDAVRGKFDLLLSYDSGDAERYGMTYYPTPMSCVALPDADDLPHSDVYFCGYAKNRYEVLHELFRKCVERGLKADFNIIGMPTHAPRLPGITYSDKPINYADNLRHIARTRCILEVMQRGANGFTPRAWESIVFDKHLLTDNAAFLNSEYSYLQGHHGIELLDGDNAPQVISADVQYPDTLKHRLSPVRLLQFIDKNLSLMQ